MANFGTDAAGFLTAYDLSANTVRVEVWGFLPVSLCLAFGEEIAAFCRASSGANGLLIDMTEIKPLREEGQSALIKMMKAVAAMNIRHLRIITSGALAKLQLMRLVQDAATEIKVEFTSPNDATQESS